jgi:hypothetical protein
MFLNRGEDEVIKRIEARIAKHTAIPSTYGEGLQILHYQVRSCVGANHCKVRCCFCRLLADHHPVNMCAAS